MRIQWHPKPFAEEKIIGATIWRPFWPEFRLVRPPDQQSLLDEAALDLPLDGEAADKEAAKATAFAAFRALVPERLVALVERFGSHQWPLLVMLNAKTEACELTAINPVLAYCLANHVGFRDAVQEAAAGNALMHCTWKQRNILGWLGFADTEATVRLFRKIRPEAVSPFMMQRFRHRLNTDEDVAEWLAHLPDINAGVIDLVTARHLTNLVSPKLLAAVSANENDLAMGRTPERLLMGIELLQEIKHKLPTKPITSLAHVEQFIRDCDRMYLEHEATVQAAAQTAIIQKQAEREQRRRRRRAEPGKKSEPRKRKAKPFPQPPLPGTEDFVPLTTHEALVEEGSSQRNCVGFYSMFVQTRRIYVYRVLKPQRATLSIIRGDDGCWRRSELETADNKKPDKLTVQHVDRWIASHGLSV